MQSQSSATQKNGDLTDHKEADLTLLPLYRQPPHVVQSRYGIVGHYRQTEKYAGEKSFFYFDPPYKPVNEAGACTSYMPDDFDDDCQIELAGFCKDLGEKGSK